MLSFLDHSNVIHGFICLDMLVSGDFVADQNKPYTGWSSAYSLLSILLQLQAFLFDRANVTEDAIAAAKFHQRRFVCSCGHCYSRPWPTNNNQETLPEKENILSTETILSTPVIKANKRASTSKKITKLNRKTKTLPMPAPKLSRFMKAVRCNPKAVILPLLTAATLPIIYKHVCSYSVSMVEVKEVMAEGVEKLTHFKSDTFQTLLTSISFSISPNMIFIMTILGVTICVGLLQWVFIEASAKNRNKRIREEHAKFNRAQVDVRLKIKTEKERKLTRQLEQAKLNQTRDFNKRLRYYYGDDIETEEQITTVVEKIGSVEVNSHIVHEQDEFVESPAKIRKDQRREAKKKSILKKPSPIIKPSILPNRNYNNGLQIGRKSGQKIKNTKFARNTDTKNRKWGSDMASASQPKNRFNFHDEETEESFMSKQLLLMNHSLIDMMHNSNNTSDDKRNNKQIRLDLISVGVFTSIPNEILLEM